MRYGPQPYEAILAEVCQAFGCTPSEAEGQDWLTVQRVMDYCNARAALGLFNGDEEAKAELAKHPDLVGLLLELHRAQEEVG
ncbi:MAG: hypothetical protein V2A73_08625 [Pseudomonadota bacterium]